MTRGFAQEVGDALVALCRSLGLERETFELASLILADLDRRGPWPEAWRAAPLAAALAYGAARLAGESVTQEEVASEAGTSPSSLRRSLATIALNLDLDFGVQLEAHPEDWIA
jgi:transcription initiation factor TFIIIB Brf1 subunit/transcription initiation factor TFIIB